MEFKKSSVLFNYKSVSFFILLAILPNFLGMINIPTVFEFKIHFFQIGVFISALLYGPVGGLTSGFIGSMYSAFIMKNPYIVIGNAILGFFVGFFVKHRLNTILAVMLAFCIQLPWLIVTDYYLMNLSAIFINNLIIALAISNFIWAITAYYSAKAIKKSLEC